MQILIRAAKIIDSASSHNGTIADILITDGEIVEIGTDLDTTGADEIFEGDGLHISPGWVDMFATFGEPGNEHKEDVESGLNAAAQGGFSNVAVSPVSVSPVDNKSTVEYLLKKTENHTTTLLPIGASTKGLNGKELADVFDMQNAGAVAVSNGKQTIGNSQIQNLSLLYSKNLNIPIYSFCEDANFASGGQMHEGAVNTSIGLKGIPSLAEELVVARDIYLSEYTDTPIHFSHITSKESVELIRAAKAKGLKITASVPVNHLLLTDEHTRDFDSNYKVSPPFRSEEHIKALIQGLKDRTIDAIISDHEPHEIEAKYSEFSIAEAGITSLETCFAVALEALGTKLTLNELIEKLTAAPRRILNLQPATIEVGKKADITVFAPEIEWEYHKSDVKSKSFNSPFLGRKMRGLPIAVINNDMLYLNS